LEKIADTSSLSNLNLKWMDAPGGELLSAAGYDGIARFWDEQGQLKLELPHIPDELTDQPDITLSPDKSSWLAVLANGSGFLYNTAGTLIDSLIRPSIANTMADLDSTASAVISSDGSAIVMSGRYDHIIWKKGSDGRFTFHGTFNFGHGYCTHLRAQKFQWKGRDVFLLCGRAADFDGYKLGFFDEEGKPVQALSGSHEIGNVQAFQLSQGGKRLAVIQKRKPLVIYDLDATQGFIPEAVSAPSDLQWGKVISLKWSTDQNQLVGVFRGEKLVNWRYQDGGFKVAATRALPMDSNIDENPFRSVGWFPRTLRFFYFDLGELFILNDRLEVEHQIKGFERNLDISSLAISHEKEIIAMALGNRIRITRFDLKDIRAKFCAALAPYLQLSEDFDRRAGLSPEDRNLCR
jgi:WD40 repeat protein